jgi:hypothetical protein
MADLCLGFYEAYKFFSRLVAFPPAVYKGSFSPTSSPTHVVGGIFYGSYLTGMR